MTTQSQNKQIKAHLEGGKSLTSLEALNLYGCLRLSGRIYDLGQDGLKINSEMVTRNGKRVAEYSLAPSACGISPERGENSLLVSQ